MRKVSTFYLLTVFSVLFILFLPLFVLFLINPVGYKNAHVLRKIWALILYKLVGIKVEVFSNIKLSNNQYIICANHTSYLDIPVLVTTIPIYFRFMAKAELLNIPIFNIFFKTIDIAVDRKSATKSNQSFNKALSALQRGAGLAVFPEGGIPKDAPKLHKFKIGAFKLSYKTGVPILPVTILGNWKVLDGSTNAIPVYKPGKVKVVIHDPILPNTMAVENTEIERLKQTTYNVIFSTLNQDQAH